MTIFKINPEHHPAWMRAITFGHLIVKGWSVNLFLVIINSVSVWDLYCEGSVNWSVVFIYKLDFVLCVFLVQDLISLWLLSEGELNPRLHEHQTTENLRHTNSSSVTRCNELWFMDSPFCGNKLSTGVFSLFLFSDPQTLRLVFPDILNITSHRGKE